MFIKHRKYALLLRGNGKWGTIGWHEDQVGGDGEKDVEGKRLQKFSKFSETVDF